MNVWKIRKHEKLYAASQAGVKIRFDCAWHMLLVPGVAGLSENIEVQVVVVSWNIPAFFILTIAVMAVSFCRRQTG